MLVPSALAQPGLPTRTTLAGCQRNLAIIDEAIRSYRRRNDNKYPYSLTELLDKGYLNDQRTLVCPVARASSDYRLGHRFVDSSELDRKTSYRYELTKMLRELNQGMTDRELRFLQQKSPVGRYVPVVRCFKHRETNDDQILNLRMNGKIEFGLEYWEADFRRLFPHSYLTPVAISRSQAPLSEQAPPRANVSYPPELVDLTPYYTGLLTDCWPLDIGKDTLKPLVAENPRYEPFDIDGVLFDIRGVVQLDAEPVKPKGPPRNNLSSPTFPESIQGIAVGQTASVLHLLHGTLFGEEDERLVATLGFNYADGRKGSVELRFGTNTGCWRSTLHTDETEWEPNTRIAWTAPSPVENGELRLFKTAVRLCSDVRLDSVDFHSSMSKAGPFIVAMTTSESRVGILDGGLNACERMLRSKQK